MALMDCTHSGARDDVHRSSGLHVRLLCASVTHLEGKHQHLVPPLKHRPGLGHVLKQEPTLSPYTGQSLS